MPTFVLPSPETWVMKGWAGRRLHHRRAYSKNISHIGSIGRAQISHVCKLCCNYDCDISCLYARGFWICTFSLLIGSLHLLHTHIYIYICYSAAIGNGSRADIYKGAGAIFWDVDPKNQSQARVLLPILGHYPLLYSRRHARQLRSTGPLLDPLSFRFVPFFTLLILTVFC